MSNQEHRQAIIDRVRAREDYCRERRHGGLEYVEAIDCPCGGKGTLRYDTHPRYGVEWVSCRSCGERISAEEYAALNRDPDYFYPAADRNGCGG